MANDTIRIPVAPIIASRATLHVQVTGMRTARARLWLAILIAKLAAKVGGCGLNVSADTTADG